MPRHALRGGPSASYFGKTPLLEHHPRAWPAPTRTSMTVLILASRARMTVRGASRFRPKGFLWRSDCR